MLHFRNLSGIGPAPRAWRGLAGLVAGLSLPCLALAQDGGAAGAASDEPIDARQGLLILRPVPLEEPLVTDRPDFTESTDAVPRGHLQIEAGYTFTYDSGDPGTRSHDFPQALFRLGVATGVELRIGVPGYARIEQGDDHVDGLTDTSVGAKVKLLEQDGLVPHFGVLGEVTFPTGADGITSDGVDPKVGLLWAYDLTDRLSLAGNVNFASVSEDDDDRFFETSVSTALGVGITDDLGVFIEYFGFFRDTAGPTHFIDGGVTYLIGPNLQLDGFVGFGLNGRADDVFAGGGVSWRY